MFTNRKIKKLLKDIDVIWGLKDAEDIYREAFFGNRFSSELSDMSKLDMLCCNIIGVISINRNTVPCDEGDIVDYLYLIKKNRNNKKLYVSVEGTPSSLWYEFSDPDTLNIRIKELVKLYNIQDIGDNFERCYRYLGTVKKVNHDMGGFISKFVADKYTEYLLWGSKWDDYPYNREDVRKLTGREVIHCSSMALKQIDNFYSISTRSMYSKSLITVIDCNMYYAANIKYKPLSFNNSAISKINKKLCKHYPLDLPVDVIIALQDYQFIDPISMLYHNTPYLFSFNLIEHIIPLNETRQLLILLGELERIMEYEKSEGTEADLNIVENFYNHIIEVVKKYQDRYIPYREESFEDWY
tara:strand:+ start:117 stop:1181 length:1065 start_codon:yes stop_codon:yes gene_type:complete